MSKHKTGTTRGGDLKAFIRGGKEYQSISQNNNTITRGRGTRRMKGKERGRKRGVPEDQVLKLKRDRGTQPRVHHTIPRTWWPIGGPSAFIASNGHTATFLPTLLSSLYLSCAPVCCPGVLSDHVVVCVIGLKSDG